MSPEILDGTFEHNKTWESYKRNDVYAFSLVIWEVMRRTRLASLGHNQSDIGQTIPMVATANEYTEYALPYHADVGHDPSFDEMKKVVCMDEKRPDIPQNWRDTHPFFGGVCKIMEESWCKKPSSRLSMLRIKKNLNHLNRCAMSEPDCGVASASHSCYFSTHPVTAHNYLAFAGASNSNDTGRYGRGCQYQKPAAAVGQGRLGFSHHSLTGGGVGGGQASAGSGSVNSAVTQTSYCSSGYQSKLGSQSGGVEESGLAANENFSLITEEAPRSGNNQ